MFGRKKKDKATEYVSVEKSKDRISVCLNIEDDRIMDIGEKMDDIYDGAYTNGYNWDAFSITIFLNTLWKYRSA